MSREEAVTYGRKESLNRTVHVLGLLTVFLLLGGVAVAGTAAAQTPINSCGAIGSSGDYVVDANLDGEGGDCIVVEADDVTIENDGNVISNSTGTNTAAVNVTSGVSNVELVDLIVEDSYHAVYAPIEQGETTSELSIDGLTAETNISNDAINVTLGTDSTIDGFDVLDSTTVSDSEAVYMGGELDDISILDVHVSNNDFETNSDGIEVESDSANRTTVRNIRVTDNVVNADSDAIYIDGDADSTGGITLVEDFLVAGNTIEGSQSDGIEFDYDSNGFQGPVRGLTVRDNVINGASDAGIEFEPNEDGFVGEDITFSNNVINNADNEGFDLDMDGDGQNLELEVVGNEIDGGSDGIDIDYDGDGQTADIRFIGNEVTNFDDDGIYISDLQMHNSISVRVVIRDNLVDDGGLGNAGIDLDTDSGTGGPDGELLIEGNEIRATEEGIDKDSGPVTGIEIHENILVGGDFGIDNSNTTVGTFLDATNNFWGASDGPGSPTDADAPFADPVTGTLADGSGSNVTEGGTAGVSNVHFAPFASSPDFGKCIDRRDLGRGQESQECPNDREIDRGGSREELDRETGRSSDSSRRDRGRGESARRDSRGR
jgi:hypothetical protein